MREVAIGDPRLPARFWKKIVDDVQTGCWLWCGCVNSGTGYGDIYWRGRTQRAHRVAFEALVGPIPAGLQIDHLCRVRRCVRPDHLDAVTGRENIRRGNRYAMGFYERAKTHCPQGHPYDEANTMIKQGRRYCRTCERARRRDWYRRNRRK